MVVGTKFTLAVAAALVAAVGVAAFADAKENDSARHKALSEAKRSAMHNFTEARKEARAELNESLRGIRESYLENKTKVIDGCRDTHPAWNNTTSKDEKLEYAHCVRDGLKPLKDKARTDIEDARETFREAIEAARDAAKAAFANAKSRAPS